MSQVSLAKQAFNLVILFTLKNPPFLLSSAWLRNFGQNSGKLFEGFFALSIVFVVTV